MLLLGDSINRCVGIGLAPRLLTLPSFSNGANRGVEAALFDRRRNIDKMGDPKLPTVDPRLGLDLNGELGIEGLYKSFFSLR